MHRLAILSLMAAVTLGTALGASSAWAGTFGAGSCTVKHAGVNLHDNRVEITCTRALPSGGHRPARFAIAADDSRAKLVLEMALFALGHKKSLSLAFENESSYTNSASRGVRYQKIYSVSLAR